MAPLLEDTEILRVLRNFNPWWITGSIPALLTPPVRRQAFYEIEALLKNPTFRRGIVLLGPRRVGKTTILYQHIAAALASGQYRPEEILYVSFDHPLLRLASLERLLQIFRNNIAAGSEHLLVCLDEIQTAPDWAAWLKVIIDRHPYQIIATGSASSLLTRGGQESGVGRWVDLRIPTLSFYEYLQIVEAPLPALPEDLEITHLASLPRVERERLLMLALPLEVHFHRYLLVGGFPEIAKMDNLLLAQQILREDVADKVLKRDLPSLYGVRNLQELERIFLYLCLHSGQILVQETIAREIEITRQTLNNYLHYLEMAHLIYRLDPCSMGGKKALKSKPKIYLADPALRNAILVKGEEVLTDRTEMGLIVENALCKHLVDHYRHRHPSLGYWRNAKGQEVDFLLRFPDGSQIAIEVKYRDRLNWGPQEGLYACLESVRPTSAFLISKQTRHYGPLSPAAGGITPFAIPAFFFLYLLGRSASLTASSVISRGLSPDPDVG